jgi:cysteine desulfurase
LRFYTIDVDEFGADLISLSGHKAYGPKGIGALYVRRGTRLSPLLHGGGQEQGLRSGTLPTPLCVGFGAACSILRTERPVETKQIMTLRDRLWTGLQSAVPDIAINSSAKARHPGNLNVRFRSTDSSILLNALQPRIAASTGAACTTGMPEPSHVLRAIGLTSSEADRSIRLSIGRFTSTSQIDAAVALIAAAVRNSICREEFDGMFVG